MISESSLLRTRRVRRLVDPINSVAWFAMDGLWLAQWQAPAYAALLVTLSTGGLLLYWSRRRDEDLALNAWMWMNALWMTSDLNGYEAVRKAALAVGCFGGLVLAISLRPSRRRRKPLRRFRRIRARR
ncbi:hypothetical protein OJF2_36200 [Aquisphaera giovannonii]|uniref:Uncharacterized protein n=1 Tax=Aquisphaera giovannonii TaxID=406548 RepID=A0A5B9W4M7_9BACT|nr:hypothetical protein [Aquisphaera giovannonii]QEH35075.1 hypothetical protein OJF2_36200 [Aquisphaera giovannonii]